MANLYTSTDTLLRSDMIYDQVEGMTQEAVNADLRGTLESLIQESAFRIVEENGEFKLYWYGAAASCPYSIVYENGVYNLYFNYDVA